MTTTTAQQLRHIAHLRFELPDTVQLEDLRPLLEQVTPQVQLLEPDTAVLDVTGALRFWNRTAAEIARLIQLRAAAHHSVRAAAGTGPSRMVAAMACALTPPGHLTTVEPDAVAAFLRPRPVRELPGVGPATARLLIQHGVHTVGDLAGLPLATVQRLLGARTGRTLHDRTHGHDHRPVVTEPVARSTSAEHRFTRDELDPAQHRRALLDLAGQLGTRLRTDAQVAASLTITVRYADGSTTTRTRTLAEATHHTALLARSAYDLYDTLGLQRARVRSITLRGENLRPAEHAARQLAFDHTVDKALLIEAVQDRARQRYGTDVIKPAALAERHRSTTPGNGSGRLRAS
ncbi:DNA polymerase thumb domain-containing protein [Streptomyces anulatus]|uniref:DNA polymerase Y family protein n=1 Tax=Streptomyces anulatus TaxID=1892 RepID=UPI002F9082DD